MKNQYAGAIGDYGKYGLLRALCRDGDPRLGMAWWMSKDDGSNSGGRIGYLEQRSPALRDCDPELFDALARMVTGGWRCVNAVCALDILPRDTLHHLDTLNFDKESTRADRNASRKEWVAGAVRKLAGAELVHFDPDVGISDTLNRTAATQPMHVFPDELAAVADPDRSITVYHHVGRSGSANEQFLRAAGVLHKATGREHRPWILRCYRGSAHGYLISPAERHRELLRSRLDNFLSGPWGKHKHFEEISPIQSPK